MIQNNTKRQFPYVSTEDAAERMGICQRTVAHRIRLGYLPAVKVGSEQGRGGAHYLIHVADLVKEMAKRKGKNGAAPPTRP